MANFDSVGSGFSRGFATGSTLRMNRDQQQFQQQTIQNQQKAEAAQQIAEQIEKSRTEMESQQEQTRKLAVEALRRGIDPKSDKFQQLVKAQEASVMAHANALAALGYEDQAQQVVERQKAFFETSIANVTPDDEQVVTFTPEQVVAAGFPEGAIVQQRPDKSLDLVFDPTDDEASLEIRARLLQESGLPEDIAKGVAATRYSLSADPLTRELSVIDIGTGDVVFGGASTPPEPSDRSAELIPKGIETPEALGTEGVLKAVGNFITDAVGAGLAFPEAKEATNALESLKVYTTTTLQEPIPGRPSVFLLEQLEGLTVKPNSIFQGEGGAESRLKQTRRLIDAEIARMENEVLPSELDPKTRQTTNLNLSQLKRLSGAYTDILAGFDEQEDVVSPEARKLMDDLLKSESAE